MVLGEHFGPVRSELAAPETEENLVLLARDLVDRERDAGIRHVDDDVDVVDVEPLPRDVGADVGLVLVVGADDLDLHAVRGRIEILDRHFGGGDRTGAADVGIKARHVGEHADLDGLHLARARPRRDISAATARARLDPSVISTPPYCAGF